MKKKCLLLSAGLLVILASAGFFIGLTFLDRRPGVTKANFDRIETGMTREEVDALFGDEVLPFLVIDEDPNEVWPIDTSGNELYSWSIDDVGMAHITFHNGIVVERAWYDRSDTLLEKLRRWLRI
jgi:hypothetical protein